MSDWLLKTDPATYGWADLEREGRTVWDGVGNNLALQHMRRIAKGDLAFIYHSGGERTVVGLARAVSDPYPDPAGDDPKRVVFDLAADRALPRAVALSEIKADPLFADFDLVRLPRLSVMPVPPAATRRLLALAERTAS